MTDNVFDLSPINGAQYWEAQADMWHANYADAQKEIEKLRDTLVGIACNCEADGEDCYYGHVLENCPHRQARAALKETGDD